MSFKKKKKVTGTVKRPRRKLLKDGSVPEKYIQASILNWLKTTGYQFWRANSGTVWVHGRRVFLGPDGMPDIVVIIPPKGIFLGLEVKSKNGKVRKDQIEFAKKLTEAGGLYSIVRSLSDAQAATAEAVGR